MQIPISGSIWRAGVVPRVAGRVAALLLALALVPLAAFAGCDDAPGPGVDWNSCEKYRLLLRKADLRGAKLGATDLNGSDLESANLAGADLSRTNLANAKLAGAKLAQARMFRTRVDGVDLSLALGLVQGQIDTACGDAKTVLPKGLKAPAAWPCAKED